MGKKSWLYKLLKRFGVIKTHKLTFEEKAEMCRQAVSSGVCPKSCDRCAWGIVK